VKKLAGKKHYNLLLFDNEVPGLSGLALVSLARSMEPVAANHHGFQRRNRSRSLGRRR